MKRKQPPISKPRKPLDRPPPDFNFEEEISDAIPEDKMFGPVAESPFDQTDDELLSGPGFGPPFLEKLVMGIIASRKLDPATMRKKLNKAMLALVGRKADPAPFPMEIAYKEDQALQWMADQVATDRWDIRKGAPEELNVAILLLARKAVDRYMPSSNEAVRKAAAKRLQEKFTGTYDKKLKRGPSGDARRTHIYRAVEHDHIRETVEAQQLQKIGEILSRHGIETAFDEIL